jgi:SPP1 Gp6-like portal protein
VGLTIGQALELVATLEMELTQRQEWVQRADDYYRGRHPLRFASEDFREYFAKRYDGFSDNWVPVVADSPVERLTVQGFRPYGGDIDKESWRVWQVNALDADSQLGFLASVNASRSYVLVWGDPDDADTPCVTFEDAAQAVVGYYPGSRYRRRAALKRWQDGNTEYCTLYTADELWKFQRALSRIEKSPAMAAFDEQANEWLPRDTAEPNPQRNPMDMVPMVELPNRPMLAGPPVSDVAPVIPLQDAVNLLWAHLFTGSDYASLQQRYLLGADRPTEPVYDDDGKQIGEREVDLKQFMKDRILWVEGEGVTAGSWPAADLASFSDVIETAIGHLAAQTRTPQHYLIGKMANLSSDALIAAEAGLIQRTKEKQLWFGQALREMWRLVALAQNDTAKAEACRAGEVLWADTESRSQAQLTASLVALKSIGWPFEDLAMRYGLTPTQVSDLMEMRKREAEEDPMLTLMSGRTDTAVAAAETAEVKPGQPPDATEPPLASGGAG